MAKHAVFNSDLMFGTQNPAGLINVLIPEDLDNGSVLKVGALVAGSHDVFTGVKPAASDTLASLCIVAAPEVMYDEKLNLLSDFYNMVNVNGGVVRGYLLHSGDIFSMTKEGFSGTPAVGASVNVAAAYKLAAGASSGTKVGTIIAQEGDFYVVRVLA